MRKSGRCSHKQGPDFSFRPRARPKPRPFRHHTARAQPKAQRFRRFFVTILSGGRRVNPKVFRIFAAKYQTPTLRMATNRKIQTALVSVYHKDGLEPLLRALHRQGVQFLSTGGTHDFICSLGLPCERVEDLTGYPSILGGRVKTLHPKVFGGILGRRDLSDDVQQMAQYEIGNIDLVIVDLYPSKPPWPPALPQRRLLRKSTSAASRSSAQPPRTSTTW